MLACGFGMISKIFWQRLRLCFQVVRQYTIQFLSALVVKFKVPQTISSTTSQIRKIIIRMSYIHLFNYSSHVFHYNELYSDIFKVRSCPPVENTGKEEAKPLQTVLTRMCKSSCNNPNLGPATSSWHTNSVISLSSEVPSIKLETSEASKSWETVPDFFWALSSRKEGVIWHNQINLNPSLLLFGKIWPKDRCFLPIMIARKFILIFSLYLMPG